MVTPYAATALVCIAWIVSWILASRWSSPASARPGFGREWKHHVVTIIGIMLIFGLRAPNEWYGRRLWPVNAMAGWALVAVAVGGFAFTWWARVHLGKLWSATVQRKADHRVVDTGPYGIVRHPIYTGILLATYATMALKGTIPGVAGAVLITLGLWMKARLEEGWLAQELGAEAYADYSSRVSMLIPFI